MPALHPFSPLAFQSRFSSIKMEKGLSGLLSFFRGHARQGQVALVGAGPGDPELITRKGWQRILEADILVYDALVSQELLDEIPAYIKRIYVGKRKGHHSMSQHDINQLLVELGQQGLKVVRLKGGDPLIFGRVTEEIQALQAADIPYTIIPGITAAAGCAARFGFSLTERGIAPRLRLITAHFCDDRDINWADLAKTDETLVFYMGLSKVSTISQELQKHGLPAHWPVLFVENGTHKNERMIKSTLAEMTECVTSMALQSPTLIYIGQVTLNAHMQTEASYIKKAHIG